MNCELAIASQFKSWLMYLPTLPCDSVLVVQRSRFLLVKQQSLRAWLQHSQATGVRLPA
ncbi:unnamed protein product [Mycena citricolor]|uniref:Uncharacterized protein n=1 Tax=Mycena citricolor TaxID=2018698 RepID=A0AAD2HED0_9AGAR|nr:unnamed protein product [Mycena citricolor]